jgi:hypothetical protein
MSQQAKDFDFASGDMEAFLNDVVGINILFRNRMRAILKSEDNEMPRMRELFITMVRREESEGVHLMNEDFKAGFVKLFNMNANKEMQIAE